MKITELKALVSESFEEMMKEAMSARSLQKGKSYDWTMGAIPLTITYVGPRSENPEIKVGSSVGKGYIFQWDHDGKYLELGPITIYQHVKEVEEDDSALDPRNPEDREDSKYDGYVSKEMGGNPDLYESYQKGYNDAKTKYKKLAEAYVKLQKK